MKYTCLLLVLVFTVATEAIGGGSVEWTFHALPILKKHPELLGVIEASLDVAPTGYGIRLGKDAGEEQGKRIPPYEFPARPKGSSGPFDMLLVIHDPSGAGTEDYTWIEIRPKK